MTWGVEQGRWEVASRVLGRVRGGRPGPTLIAVGGLHGNETAGIFALQRVLAALWSREAHLSGELVALRGNRRALAQNRRFLSRDLNRLWTPEGVEAVREAHARSRRGGGIDAGEEDEQAELLQVLEDTVARARGEVLFLDLHTTSGPGPPFTTVADARLSGAFARAIPAPLILGLGAVLTGTLNAFVTSLGIPSVVFEGGQHRSPGSIASSEAAVWLGLAAAGVLRQASFPEVRRGSNLLRGTTAGLPPILEMRYRHPVRPDDGFRMLPGFKSFQTVSAGEILARDRHGTVRSPTPGRLLLPLYQSQGEDGFFLVREVVGPTLPSGPPRASTTGKS
jgi:succinylglutamate desuccinylase